jgi:trans-aconitate methyltransferase
VAKHEAAKNEVAKTAGVKTGEELTANPWDAQEYDATFGFVSRYGDELLDLLAPRTGERILDLGCGTGRHAAEIAARGARVVGMDLDEGMLDKARADHPTLRLVRADAALFDLESLGEREPFDACFSNAALHWMTPQDAVLANVRSVVATGARFVAEMGGAENIAALDASLRAALVEIDRGDVPVPANYFPTVGEQSALLEANGFRVERMSWFRRPSRLAQGSTAADWTRHFRAMVWSEVPEELHAELARAVDTQASGLGLHDDDGWFADYCRLRFMAVAVDAPA